MRSNAARLRVTENSVPLSELGASASGLMKKLRESGQAVVLTEEGRPAAVLITPEVFDGLRQRDRVIAAVERGRADLRAGRVIDDEDLSRDVEARFGSVR